MAHADKVTLFKEFDEGGFRVRVHLVTVEVASCFVIQAVDLQRSLPVYEEVCPPLKHDPSLFIHEEDLLDLEIKTDEIMMRLTADGRRPACRAKGFGTPKVPNRSGG